MQLIFEKSRAGRSCSVLPSCDVPDAPLPARFARSALPKLPSLDENEISRHYSSLAKRSFGVNDGFYPLGSCTMKYNPKVNEEIAGLAGFTGLHPLQGEAGVQGALEVLELAEKCLTEITGMDAMTFQPAAGAHGEFTGLLVIKAYHAARGDTARTKIIVPDSAHGTNPASAIMAGFEVVNLTSTAEGYIDLAALRAAVGTDTAGLMLTNPNTLGLFDPNILEITDIVHKAGGLNYYDGANLNAIVGKVRPGDMGFDTVHLNLHKTFSTPHGGGGPGSGAVGCTASLAPFLPKSRVKRENGRLVFADKGENGAGIGLAASGQTGASIGASVSGQTGTGIGLAASDQTGAGIGLAASDQTGAGIGASVSGQTGTGIGLSVAAQTSIGRVRAFHGNFLVVVRALAYILSLGKEGIPQIAENAVINANYMMARLREKFDVEPKAAFAKGVPCMHEFVLSLENLKAEKNVSALDMAKAFQDSGMHPPTMYFPLIVHEALMIEPTETESKETLDAACDTLVALYDRASTDAEALRSSPRNTVIGRPDEVKAARNPLVRHNFQC
jgi:glycine dehydrogenase subunit 2